jgi:hypothetical protein
MVNPVNDANTSDIPPVAPVTEDESTAVDPALLKKNALDLMAQEIFERINPEDITSLVKFNPSGKESGGNNPFDVFSKVSGGGGGGGSSTPTL